MVEPCVFCKIATGGTPAKLVFSNDQVAAFRDIHPQAPTHILIVPRRHIPTMNDLTPKDLPLVGMMVQAAVELARQEKIDERGYRLVWNCNAEAGQSVFHLHAHLLGGRAMQWPPG